MHVRIIRNRAQFVGLGTCWDELLESYHNLPFYSWTWYSTWWNHFGQTSDLFVLVAQEHPGRIDGIAPLLRSRTYIRGLPVKEIHFLDNAIGPRNGIFLRPGDVGHRALRGMVQCLVEHRREWDLATLTNMDVESPYMRDLILEAQHAGMRVVNSPARQTPYIQIDGDFSAYWADNFNSKHRSNVTRHLRMSNQRGQYRVIDYTAANDMAVALGLAFQVSANSWKGRLGTHMNGRPDREGFYRDLTALLAERRQVRIWLAMLDNRPIAVSYQLVSDKAVHSLVSDFDDSFRDLAPGNVLLYHILQKLCLEGKSGYDFCGNLSDYEKPWATGTKPHVTLQFFNRNWYSWFIFATKTRILPLFSTVRGLYQRIGGYKKTPRG